VNILVVLAAFVATGIPWVEALTIVMAVGLFKGWRSAIVGVVGAFLVLIVVVGIFGVTAAAYLDTSLVHLLVGVFLLLFGLKWLHKAILRTGGVKSMPNEAKAFEAAREKLTAGGERGLGLDWGAAATSFSGVFMEGLEVVFIVLALGGLYSVPSVLTGTAASLVAVGALGAVVRGPLTQVPENAIKYVVGLFLTSFGTLFAGQGVGVSWWHQDLAVLPLIGIYGVASLVFVLILRREPRARGAGNPVLGVVRAGVLRVWNLFVDDGALTPVAIASVLLAAVVVDRFEGQRMLASGLLVVGVLLAVIVGIVGPARARKPKPKPAPKPADVPTDKELHAVRN
jgi:uncharacterized membrane protein